LNGNKRIKILKLGAFSAENLNYSLFVLIVFCWDYCAKLLGMRV